MKLIIPMAGMGTRMRPHTLITPKPLLPIAGISIVQRLAEEITKVSASKITEIGFIIGDFGQKVENQLKKIAQNLAATPKIYYQHEPLGTAHAIFCAAPSLSDKVIVAFADTLFKADFNLDENADAVIWTKNVENPEAFGVVKLSDGGKITDFIEKPKTFVSNQAIIGIYYFKNGNVLHNELKYLLDNKITVKGEYQLTDALENMKNKGQIFVPGTVTEWLDCGNKNATVYTNKRILHHIGNTISKTLKLENSVVIPPCYISDNVNLKNCVIGPYVSIGENTEIKNSVISNSILLDNSVINYSVLTNSMTGNFAKILKNPSEISLGDYSQI